MQHTFKRSTDMLADILKPNLAVVFCGINPGLSSAEAGLHFARRSNRFWRAIHLAGFTPHEIAPEQGHTLLDYGCGLTTAVARASRRADELSAEELRQAADALEAKIERLAPRAIAFLGKAAFSAMHPGASVEWGMQPMRFGGSVAWVLPNPSGLNRGFTLDALVERYSELRRWAYPASRRGRT